MEGNKYFEQQTSNYARTIADHELVRRSKECQGVLDHLESDTVWKTVLNDCKRWVDHLDAHWQEVYDEKQLLQMRVLKYAYNHIFSLPEKYKEEYKTVTDEITRREASNEISMDYDTETNLEK